MSILPGCSLHIMPPIDVLSVMPASVLSVPESAVLSGVSPQEFVPTQRLSANWSLSRQSESTTQSQLLTCPCYRLSCQFLNQSLWLTSSAAGPPTDSSNFLYLDSACSCSQRLLSLDLFRIHLCSSLLVCSWNTYKPTFSLRLCLLHQPCFEGLHLDPSLVFLTSL